jgi:putative flavoprotein involved in K+ transport
MTTTPITTAPAAHHVSSGSTPLDVLVIGAGQAGLALAWHLNRRRARYLLLDAAPEPGHSWRTRWDSLRLFTPAQYDSLPGTPFPGAADTHPTKDQVADYLTRFAETHAVPLRSNTRVTRLEVTDGGQFVAHTTQGRFTAHQVVVATGAFHHPHLPVIEGAFDAAVSQLHSSRYRNTASVATGRVLVVGGGNSGLQIAQELNADHDVVVAAGTRPLALPQRVGGRDLFWWLQKLGLMDASADSPLARRVRARGDLVIGTDRKQLARDGVDFRGRLVAASGRHATFADGTSAEVDAVVWATGFEPDFSWIDADVTGPDGHLRHHDGRTDVAGLWTLGQPWQRTRGSALLGFVQRDAEHVADQLVVTAPPKKSVAVDVSHACALA